MTNYTWTISSLETAPKEGQLIDAFPIGIGPQSLNWADDGFHRLTVQFAYQKYRPIYDGTYNLAAAATALFGSGLSRILPLGRAL